MTDARRPRRLNESSGVTLVELMVVLVVFAVGILSLAAVQTRSNRVVFDTGQETRALSVGQSRIEVARAAGFAGAVTDSGRADVFDWRTDVSSAGTGLSRVQVTVSWLEGGSPRSIQLNTLLAAR
jgi:prepilin-type N-terminal cleavage/methylation domain-containing protein